ncbi:uncharacterized protein LOC114574878 [Exaiptasia diaphana]|uniref:Uncharacterized protein n=1 Tax=Exaiptasia diaphana TaxID=2652724 RepID=A0A913YGY6_EXADI|nr:uncharacterized protein LOC114574878 [Exaiptasia diaphana]
MQLASIRVPMTQGAEFMGELASVILKMFKDNKVSDAKKCIKYCELYATLTSIRDMILTQFISMSSNVKNVQNDVNGLIGYRQNFRDGTKALFEKLYTVDYFSNIMPYFDPDDSTVTDTYSTVMLNLGKYDRSLSGQYCLQYEGNKDFEWQRKEGWFELTDERPYTTVRSSTNNLNCFWKLIPHGKSTYSIVNKYKCDKKYDYCDAMLSWDSDDNKAYVGLDYKDPVLWEIAGNDWRYIRNKWHCPSHKFCDKDLRVLYRRETRVFRGSKGLLVGQLALPDGKYYWKLRKRT